MPITVYHEDYGYRDYDHISFKEDVAELEDIILTSMEFNNYPSKGDYLLTTGGNAYKIKNKTLSKSTMGVHIQFSVNTPTNGIDGDKP